MAEEKKENSTEEKKNTSEEKKEEATNEEKSDEKKEVEVPEKFKSLVEEIEKMSVMDLSEFVEILEDKFGVSAAAPAMMAPAGAAAGGEAAEEKTEFDVELDSIGDNKIGVIKAVKEITGVGLKEAKDMVDGAPKVLKEAVKKEEAEEMKSKLSEAGATVNLK
ncbi:MAG TPA: 50S ribosomal protein L7/L12 [Patescibacteria group bacterium]|nr:50S ribosomal protein L7/L12 [Patescibacteria group bacterium]